MLVTNHSLLGQPAPAAVQASARKQIQLVVNDVPSEFCERWGVHWSTHSLSVSSLRPVSSIPSFLSHPLHHAYYTHLHTQSHSPIYYLVLPRWLFLTQTILRLLHQSPVLLSSVLVVLQVQVLCNVARVGLGSRWYSLCVVALSATHSTVSHVPNHSTALATCNSASLLCQLHWIPPSPFRAFLVPGL